MSLRRLQEHIRQSIPLAQAMDLRLSEFAEGCLRATAPLNPNRNDKGCAFGGSLASLMTLAGWGVVVLNLGEAADDAEVYVQDSRIRYLAPVWEDIVIEARLDGDTDIDSFRAAWSRYGRARTTIEATCRLADGSVAASLQARFVALTARAKVS